MTAKNRTDIQSEIDSLLADNVTGDISPSDVRIVHETSKDSNVNLLESTTQVVTGLVNYTGGLQVSGAGVVPIANRVVVNVAADFPTPVSDVITLAANTEYFLGDNNIDIGNDDFALGANVVISGGSIGIAKITTTSTGTLFTGSDVGSFTLKNCDIDADLAAIFGITDTVPGVSLAILLNARILKSASLGTMTDLLAVNFSNSGIFCTDQGLSFSGNTTVISFRQVNFTSTSATVKLIDLGSNVSPTIEFNDVIFNAPSGAIGISGLASSGNVTSGSIANVNSCEFLGGITPLENITVDDIRWRFKDNSGIKDTQPDALLSLTANATNTVISAVNTPTLVAGTWVVERASFFTGTTAGRATYIGETDLASPIIVAADIEPAAGANKDLKLYIALNGTVITSSGRLARVDSGNPQSLTALWQLVLTTNDFIEIFVENTSDSTDILVSGSAFIVR